MCLMAEERAITEAEIALRLANANYQLLVECAQLLLVDTREPEEALIATTLSFIAQVMTETEALEALAVAVLRDARLALV